MMKNPQRRGAPAVTTPSRAYKREPRLPHERDESSEPGAPVNEDARKVGAQAARDVARGLVDTDIGPVLERVDAEHFSPRSPARKRPGQR
jgi:hypothetical protein